MGNLKSFEELECWKRSSQLRIKIFALVKTFPSEEKFRLADQMIRSLRSAPSQIAEGYGRFHYQENIQYCRQGRGSLYELLDQLITSNECIIWQKRLLKLRNRLNHMVKTLLTFNH